MFKQEGLAHFRSEKTLALVEALQRECSVHSLDKLFIDFTVGAPRAWPYPSTRNAYTWRSIAKRLLGSQEPGKNIPYETLYPKTSESHVLAIVMPQKNAPRTRPSKATQRHPYPRYMPPTHFVGAPQTNINYLDKAVPFPCSSGRALPTFDKRKHLHCQSIALV
jgi:hypothetical protein